MRTIANRVFKLSLLSLAPVFISMALISCSHLKPVKVSYESPQFKRSWVRRLATKESLRTNEIAQNFIPIVKNNGNVIQASSFGGIFELNELGQKKWFYKTEYGVAGAGSVYKNFVFFGTEDKHVHAYDTNSKSILWSALIEGAVTSISDFSNGKIFVLTDMGSLYALKASNGVVDWKVSYPPRLLKIYGGAKPILLKGNIVAAFPNGIVASLGQKTGKVTWESKLQGAQKHEDVDFLTYSKEGYLIAGVFDEALYRLDSSTGKVVWQAYEKPVSAPSVFQGKLYFSNSDGELISLKLSSGNLVSRKKVFKGLGGKPLFLNGKMVVSDSKGPLRLLNKDNGKVLAEYDFVSAISSELTLNKSKDKFYLLTDKGYLYYFGLR